MGWQKTFTLSRRKKGCYLITDEVRGEIEPGLRDVQASIPAFWARIVTDLCPKL